MATVSPVRCRGVAYLPETDEYVIALAYRDDGDAWRYPPAQRVSAEALAGLLRIVGYFDPSLPARLHAARACHGTDRSAWR